MRIVQSDHTVTRLPIFVTVLVVTAPVKSSGLVWVEFIEFQLCRALPSHSELGGN